MELSLSAKNWKRILFSRIPFQGFANNARDENTLGSDECLSGKIIHREVFRALIVRG
jgi:hypothetical protein